jgi:mannose-6-phosphate isomerase-like protein (cupin superfamily)
MQNFSFAQLDEIEPTSCPCGWSRRAFAEVAKGPASAHLLQIEADARVHYHRKMTEIYIVLQGEGFLELDGEQVPVRPLSAVMIKPGCRHRAIGKMAIINFAVPAFDPADEWFD